MKIKTLFAIVTVSVLIGCKTLEIPEGTYVAESSKEFIIVKKKTITFHLIFSHNPKYVYEKKCEYHLMSDGSIIPEGLASSEYFLGIGRYEWYFDGMQIHRKEPKRMETLTTFIRKQ